MIQINLLTEDLSKRLEAVSKFYREFRQRSFSQRHPELGKMIRCHCGRRHREAEACLCPPLTYSTEAQLGHFWRPSQLKGKRILPHHSANKLQLVERTQQKFPNFQPFFSDPELAMKEARKEAQRELKKECKAESKRIRQQQIHSRKINSGLANPGSRP